MLLACNGAAIAYNWLVRGFVKANNICLWRSRPPGSLSDTRSLPKIWPSAPDLHQAIIIIWFTFVHLQRRFFSPIKINECKIRIIDTVSVQLSGLRICTT
jgi:hypothetical protein